MFCFPSFMLCAFIFVPSSEYETIILFLQITSFRFNSSLPHLLFCFDLVSAWTLFLRLLHSSPYLLMKVSAQMLQPKLHRQVFLATLLSQNILLHCPITFFIAYTSVWNYTTVFKISNQASFFFCNLQKNSGDNTENSYISLIQFCY